MPLLLVTTLLSMPGCCTAREAPLLPPGRPQDQSQEILRRSQLWLPGEGVPTTDIKYLMVQEHRWRSYAQALEAAGGWR